MVLSGLPCARSAIILFGLMRDELAVAVAPEPEGNSPAKRYRPLAF